MTNAYFNLGDPATRLGIARSEQINAFAAAVRAAFDQIPDPVGLQTNRIGYAETTGSGGAYVATVSPWPLSLSEGMRVRVKCNHTNPGGNETFTLNGFALLPIRDNAGATLVPGMMMAGTIVTLTYVSGRWQLDQVTTTVSVTLPDGSVANAKLADNSVSTNKIANGAVSNNKLANMAAGTLKGRASGAGSPTDLTASEVRDLLGITSSGFSYNRSNVLGSVSQIFGAPQGALIESGSGANGEFTRFASGLQICRLDNFTLPYNSATDCFSVWPFPSAFAEVDDLVVAATLIPPTVGGNTTSIANRAGIGAPQIGPLIATACGIRVNRITGTTDFTSGQSLNVSLLAIGRWF